MLCVDLTVTAPRDKAVTEVERHPCPHGIYILGGGRGKGWTREESNIRNVLDNEKCGEGKEMKQGTRLGGIERDVENILDGMSRARLLEKDVAKQRPNRMREPIIKWVRTF